MKLSLVRHAPYAVIIAALATYTTISNATNFPDKEDHTAIGKRVSIIQKKYENPGLNIGIVHNGSLVFHKAFGVMDMATKEPTNPDAVYQIASVTKTFVGTLAAQLIHEGKVDLDAPVSTYDKRLQFHPSLKDTTITLRHLLTHTSGLAGNPSNRKNIATPANMPEGYDPTISKPYNNNALYEGVAAAKLKFEPGTMHSYSNFGFNLAGHILTKISGYDTLESALNAKVFKPFNMADTSITLSEKQLQKLATPYVYIKEPRVYGAEYQGKHYFKAPHWQFGTSVGGAGVASTVPDIAKIIGYVSAKHDNNEGPISLAAINEMLSPNHEYIRSATAPHQQALGWRMNTFGNYGLVYRHNGHNDGHHAFVAFSREHKLGVIILTNGSFDGMELLGNRVLLYTLNQIAGKEGITALPSP